MAPTQTITEAQAKSSSSNIRSNTETLKKANTRKSAEKTGLIETTTMIEDNKQTELNKLNVKKTIKEELHQWVMRFELIALIWKNTVLPLNHTHNFFRPYHLE